ncbi:MAG: hypothetical protein Q4C96_11240 [Planctomycetia bacterium]|nr:hypothetical protein [Planctomycetia bacterium]
MTCDKKKGTARRDEDGISAWWRWGQIFQKCMTDVRDGTAGFFGNGKSFVLFPELRTSSFVHGDTVRNRKRRERRSVIHPGLRMRSRLLTRSDHGAMNGPDHGGALR